MRFLPFKQGAFSAAVSMDTSFGYLPSEQDDMQSIRELDAALGRGGVLVVDVFNREHLIKRHQASGEPKWREYRSFFLQQKRTLDAKGERLHDLWVIKDKADGQTQVFEHVARLYTLDGLQGLLEKAGFPVKAVYGDYDGQSWIADSSRLILVTAAK
jgi:SAM-dependent methyltransferase